MRFARSLSACAVIAALMAPGAASARPVIEDGGKVAKRFHIGMRAAQTAPTSKVAPKAKVDEAFVWPVVGAINTPFGGDHDGIDIEGLTGDKIIAARGGTVTFAGDDGDGYGLKVLISHPGGYETLYSHLSSIAVKQGSIAQGDLVGYVGCTGSCTGDHLHFEIHRNGAEVDPLGLLP